MKYTTPMDRVTYLNTGIWCSEYVTFLVRKGVIAAVSDEQSVPDVIVVSNWRTIAR
jgi:hypothetical protein